MSRLNVLLIEDDPDDVLLAEIALNGTVAIHRVERLSEALQSSGFDVIIADLILPDSRSLQTITRLRERFHTTPIIVCTGMPVEVIRCEAINEGADVVVDKRSMDGKTLLLSIESAIYLRALRESTKDDGDIHCYLEMAKMIFHRISDIVGKQ